MSREIFSQPAFEPFRGPEIAPGTNATKLGKIKECFGAFRGKVVLWGQGSIVIYKFSHQILRVKLTTRGEVDS
jgi:hypothetical protein